MLRQSFGQGAIGVGVRWPMSVLRPQHPLWLVLVVGLALVILVGMAEGNPIESFTEPNREVSLAASEPGIVDAVNVRDGQLVKKGQVLAKLDTDALEATLELAKEKAQSRGRLEAAAAELKLRKQRLEKLSRLKQTGNAMASEWERAETDVAIAQATYVSALEDQKLYQLEIKRIQIQIQRRHIISPFDGAVTKVHKEVGESVPLHSPEVITVVQLNPLRVTFPVSQALAGKMKPGETVRISLPDSGQTLEASVDIVSPVIDPKSSTVDVQITMDNTAGRIVSGARAVMEIANEGGTLAVEPPLESKNESDGSAKPIGPTRPVSTRFQWPFDSK